MAVVLKNSKKPKTRIDADEIARSQGIKPFRMSDAIQDPSITDAELEDFLRWRQEVRNADVEAQKNCLP